MQLQLTPQDLRALLLGELSESAIAVLDSSPLQVGEFRRPVIDIRKPRMEKMFAPGDGSRHSAVALPDFGLTFTAATMGKVGSWAEAKALASKCRLLGHDDWVLPEVEELALLPNRSKSSPAIDTEFFPDTESGWYWANGEYKPSPKGYAWGVNFASGSVAISGQGNSGFVRFVRRVSPSQ